MTVKAHTVDYLRVEERYGDAQFQTGELYLPEGGSKGTVCLLHGGFWKMPYDKHQLDDVAKALVANRFSVWNIEYRRVGDIPHGYPDTFIDVITAINALKALQQKYRQLNVTPLYIAGHSAGGHLSLWLANRVNGIAGHRLALSPAAFIGLAPVVDLLKSYQSSDRQAFVREFLGCTPEDDRNIYLDSSPMALLPSTRRQVILHGDNDQALPIDEVQTYVQQAHKIGCPVEFIAIKGGTHMDFCDAESVAASRFIQWLNTQNSNSY